MRTIKTGKEILLLLASLAIFAISFEVVLWVVERGKGIRYPTHQETRPWRPHGSYTWDLYSPVLGWVNKPDHETRVAGFTVQTNTQGLRETREYDYEKIPGKVRLLAVGDSFTFGEDVEPDEVFTEVLERKMPNAEVINMGVHGYGSDQMLLTLKEEGVRYLPDLVMVGFYLGGMGRNVATFRNHNKPRFRLQGEELLLTNVPVPRTPPPDRIGEAADLPAGEPRWGCRTCAWLARRGQALRDGLAYVGVGEQWRLSEAIFREMDQASAGVGARLLVVVFPPESWAKGEFNRLLMWSFPKVMERFSKKTGIPVLDLTEDFRDHYRDPNAREIFPKHWNSEGHRFVSDRIYAHLMEHSGLLQGRRLTSEEELN